MIFFTMPSSGSGSGLPGPPLLVAVSRWRTSLSGGSSFHPWPLLQHPVCRGQPLEAINVRHWFIPPELLLLFCEWDEIRICAINQSHHSTGHLLYWSMDPSMGLRFNHQRQLHCKGVKRERNKSGRMNVASSVPLLNCSSSRNHIGK